MNDMLILILLLIFGGGICLYTIAFRKQIVWLITVIDVVLCIFTAGIYVIVVIIRNTNRIAYKEWNTLDVKENRKSKREED